MKLSRSTKKSLSKRTGCNLSKFATLAAIWNQGFPGKKTQHNNNPQTAGNHPRDTKQITCEGNSTL